MIQRIIVTAAVATAARSFQPVADGEWPFYGRDRGQRYLPLPSIN